MLAFSLKKRRGRGDGRDRYNRINLKWGMKWTTACRLGRWKFESQPNTTGEDLPEGREVWVEFKRILAMTL
jgi:hypothetical protein